MKTFIISASVLAFVAPFLSSADICGKPACANGPVEFGQRQEWTDAPIHQDSPGHDGQDISGTEWFENHMRSTARQLKESGWLASFPSCQAWAN